MNQHFLDAIYIVGVTQDRVEAIKNSINLRGFDRVKTYLLDESPGLVADHPPDLLIIDPEGRYKEALGLIKTFKNAVPVIMLGESFEEDTFLECFDGGARDFLVKPVNPSYLISRVLVALDSRRLRDQLTQRDRVLEDINAIGRESRVFSTEYLVKFLKWEVEGIGREQTPSLSIVIIQLEDMDARLAVDLEFKRRLYQDAARIIQDCCRGGDVIGEYFEDKFAVLLPNTGIDGAENVSNRVIKRLDGHRITHNNQEIPVSVRIGAADFRGCLHYEDLLNKAMENLKLARLENKKLQMA
jgi:diguanylate cyclase (GGDEF)-like protein